MRGTVGLPGSGISYTEHVPWPKGGDKPLAGSQQPSRESWAAGLVPGPLPLDSPFLSSEQRGWNARVHITPRGWPLRGAAEIKGKEREAVYQRELERDIRRAREFRLMLLGLLAAIGLAIGIAAVRGAEDYQTTWARGWEEGYRIEAGGFVLPPLPPLAPLPPLGHNDCESAFADGVIAGAEAARCSH